MLYAETAEAFLSRRVFPSLERIMQLSPKPKSPISPFFLIVRAPTLDVGYVPNAKYLAHIPHQTQFEPI